MHSKSSEPPSTKSLNISLRRTLPRKQLARLHELSDVQGVASVIHAWAVIGLSVFLVHLSQWNPIVVILALVIMGGRQLGLAILMHEAAHKTLTYHKSLNDFLGQWFCAAPMLNDLLKYRVHHVKHHRLTGSSRDPDISLVTGFPCSKSSLCRKFLRDLFLVTGIRRLYGHLLMNADVIHYTVAPQVTLTGLKLSPAERLGRFLRSSFPAIVCHIILLCILTILGVVELYCLWWVAYLSFFSLFIRIRSMAEHAGMIQVPEIEKNTRTVRANVFARMLWAPYHVNFHLEHHLFEKVPHFRLRELHKALSNSSKTQSNSSGLCYEVSYAAVIRSLLG